MELSYSFKVVSRYLEEEKFGTRTKDGPKARQSRKIPETFSLMTHNDNMSRFPCQHVLARVSLQSRTSESCIIRDLVILRVMSC